MIYNILSVVLSCLNKLTQFDCGSKMLSIFTLLCMELSFVLLVVVKSLFIIPAERERPNLCVFRSVSHVQAIVCVCCSCCWFDPQFALKIVLFNSTRISSMYELMDTLLCFLSLCSRIFHAFAYSVRFGI